MKKTMLFFIAIIILSTAFGQSEKYIKTMESNVAAFDTVRSPGGLIELANTFQRIAEAEKTQWLPFYYASLAQVTTGYMQMSAGTPPSVEKIDPIADKAEELLKKAEALTKENSELYIVKKMIASLRLMGDPMSRWQTYGPQATEALEKARSLNPNNPRVYLLEGQDKFYTPEEFGGSKTQAKALFEESIKKYESFKAESSIHPRWGLSQAQYFISQSK